MDQVDPAALPYALVRVTPDVENILERNSFRICRGFTDRRGLAEVRFGIGDTVRVTASPLGLLLQPVRRDEDLEAHRHAAQ